MSADPRDAVLEAEEAARLGGKLRSRQAVKMPTGAAVYLLTAAQNNTRIHDALWENLQAYAKHRKAKVLVSQFTYNKKGYLAREGAVKPGTGDDADYDSLWYDPRIVPHLCNERVEITRSLAFCGEVNILPTAERPLSGLQNYTGRTSCIVPHAKQHMESVASIDAAKFLYTSGAVTLRNYLGTKAGAKAEYHHTYGALVVEVDVAGDWFVRQLRATEDGTFQDLDVIVSGGRVTTGHRVEAVQWGDIHVDQLDTEVHAVNWGVGGILDTLRPRYQFMHDTLDFRARNHHDSRNPHELFAKWANNASSVDAELRAAAGFLAVDSYRDWCKTVVVESNHDAALMRWLREADYRDDPENAQLFLKAQRMVYAALATGKQDFNLLATLMRQFGVKRDVTFLRDGSSFLICKRAGGIECALHGDKGANGARGSALGFARLGRRMNVGHSHSAAIFGDVFVAGTCSKLRMNYNRGGASSWSHSHTVTYANGCRAIVTLWRGKWRAA